MEYTVIRQKRRKKLLLTVNVTGEITVKAGNFTPVKLIDDFVNKHTDWINKQRAKFKKQYHYIKTVTKEERMQMQKAALPQMKLLTEKYAAIMQVTPASVKITLAEKRWGSCSSRDTICYSYRTYLLSQKCKEYIVIHELSHLIELNHSKKFYDIVKKYMPDYKEAEKELNGYYIHLQ